MNEENKDTKLTNKTEINPVLQKENNNIASIEEQKRTVIEERKEPVTQNIQQVNISSQTDINTTSQIPKEDTINTQKITNLQKVEEPQLFTKVEETLANEPFEKEEINPTPVINNDKKEETPKKKSKIFPIIIGVVALLIAILAILYFVYNNSKNIFLSAINKEYTELTRDIHINSPYEDARKSSIVTEANANITISDVDESLLGIEGKKILEEINKINLNYTYGLDYKNKKIAYLMNFTYDQKDMLKINMYGQEKNMYIELKDLFSKYINIPYEELDTIFDDPNTSLEDMKIITKSVKDALLEALEAKDFKTTKEKIKIGSKEEKVKKISYTVDKENALKVITSIVETLKKDKKFVSTVAKRINKTEDEVNKNLDKIITGYNKEAWEGVTIAVYCKGLNNKAIQYEIVDGSSNTTTIYQKDEKEKKIIFKSGETEALTLVHENKTNTKSKTTIKVSSLDLEGIIEKDGNTYDLIIQDSKDTFKITGKYINNRKDNGNTKTENINVDLNMESKNQKLASIKITTNGTSTIGKAVEIKEDLTNSIEIEKMSEVENNEILTNMMKNETLMKFINSIMDITNANINAYNE